jgi:DNA-binding MarR family transcriptional regulator
LKSLLSPKNRRRRFQATEDHILSILIARRGREAVFGPDLFSEPAWDALLELYAAALGNRRMSLADLSRAINTPPSTTGRWISLLEGRGLVAAEGDAEQAGRLWIGLTEDGTSKIKQLTNHWGAAFLSI